MPYTKTIFNQMCEQKKTGVEDRLFSRKLPVFLKHLVFDHLTIFHQLTLPDADRSWLLLNNPYIRETIGDVVLLP